jgi:hypothetical protein
MKFLVKAAALAAIVSPLSAFAQVLAVDFSLASGDSSATTARTGHLEFLGDGDAGGGGVGWINNNNTVYNELDFRIITAGESFVAVQQQRAMAAAHAVHIGGKGTVFHVTTAGFAGQCTEDLSAAAAAASNDGNALSGVFTPGTDGTGALVVPHAFTNAAIVATSPRTDYTIAGCTPLEG